MNCQNKHEFDPPEGIYALLRIGETSWETTRRHVYRGPFGVITVPKDMKTDFASIPHWLLWLFNPMGRHQRAGLYHDACYRLQFCSRFEADALLRFIMTADRVILPKRIAIYYATRIFGWIAWRRNKRRVNYYRKLAQEEK